MSDNSGEITEQDILAFLPNYPRIDDPELPSKIAHKREFQENYMTRTEEVPPRGDLLQQQKLLKRFFTPDTPYTEGLINHGLGAGKCVHPMTKILINYESEWIYMPACEVWSKFKSNRMAMDNIFEEWYSLSQEVKVLGFPETKDDVLGIALFASPITHLYRQYVNEWLLTITLDNGHHITITKNHKLFDGKKWTTTFEIGDTIAVMVTDRKGVKKVGYAKIVNIKEIAYSGYVYDFEVHPYHNYVANDIIAHNTCTGSAIVENYKSRTLNNMTGIGNISEDRPPALVLVKNEDLMRSIQSDIIRVCTYEVYKVELTDRELRKEVILSEETKIRRMNEAISRTYEMYTYGTFVRKFVKGVDDATIRKRWSFRPIIMDEPHTLRLQPTKRGAKRKELQERSKGTKIGNDLRDLQGEREIGDSEATTEPPERDEILEEGTGIGRRLENTSTYREIHRFLHATEGTVKLLLTGTPIWDQSYEFATLMNLILPENLQFPNRATFNRYFDEESNLTSEGEEEISSRIKNRVSFLRSMITVGSRQTIGVTQPWFKYVKVYPDVMSDFQASFVDQAYRNVVVKKVVDRNGQVKERTIVGGVVYKDARDASNMVLPVVDPKTGEIDGVYGQAAFNKYAVQRIKGPKTTTTQYAITNVGMRRELKERLEEYSVKFASILDKLNANPQEVAFVYTDLVTGVGGAIMFALVLQLHGYTWLRSYRQAQRHTRGKSFVIMTSDPGTINNPIEIQNVLSVVGSQENIYGDKVQVVIGTEKISVGISILNCRQIHITLPDFNIPSTEQAEFRGIRFGSLNKLPLKERYVKIYPHISVSKKIYSPRRSSSEEDSIIVYPPNSSYSDEVTIDVYILRLAEEKDYRNSQIYRLVKKASLDCGLTYERNVLPEDEDGSRECNYQECNYECDGMAPTARDEDIDPTAMGDDADTTATEGRVWSYRVPEDELDSTTYNLFFSQASIRALINRVVNLFGRYFALRIKSVIEILRIPEDELNLLYQALNTIIDSRMVIKNRYGIPSYLKEEGSVVFLGSTVTPRSSYAESIYMERPLVTQRTSMNEIVEAIELSKDREDVIAYFGDPSTDLLRNISYTTRVLMFEELYGNDPTEATTPILELYEDDVYTMDDDSKVHILYTQEFSGVAYDVASKDLKVTGRMRIFDPDSGIWNTVEDPDLEQNYVDQIKASLDRQRSVGLKGNPYGAFGWISKRDGEFRITVQQSKGKPRGRQCGNFKIRELLNLAITRLNFLPQAKEIYANMSKDELIASIENKAALRDIDLDLENSSTSRLRRILTLANMKVDELCGELQAWFERKKLLYVL